MAPFPRALALIFAAGLISVHAALPLPYLDPSQPLETRVRDLVSRLSLDEKAGLMRNGAAGVPRLGIPSYDWWNEALHGVARAGHATVFPQAIGLAATWDDGFIHSVADTVSTEARAKYHEAVRHGNRARYYGLTFWTPNINIFRDPRWGRGQETYGEDPFLTSRIGVAFVRGLQGDDPRFLKAAACAKHFAVHSGPERLRHGFNVDPDETDFHDTYLPAFEALVREAHVEAVMTAYNSLYGHPCAVNPLLYDLLYNQWGFQGHVVSDCGAIRDLYTSYKLAADPTGAEALAVRAGLCLRCGEEKPAIAEAVRQGLLTEAEVDRSLGRLLGTLFRLGVFDPADSVPYARIPISENDSPAHAFLAEAAAGKAVVLLKNDGILPLQTRALRHLAVIGPNANSVAALLGNYNGIPSAPVTILEGLRQALGADRVNYSRGCDWVATPAGLKVISPTRLETEGLTGLAGDYFPNPDLSGPPAARRRDRPVDFDWSKAALPEMLTPSSFSVRWTGHLLSGADGDYVFSVSGNGGFRLAVDGIQRIDAWNGRDSTRTATVHLPENASVPVGLEYRCSRGPGRISLSWAEPAAQAGYAAALAQARASDAIVFVGGLTAQLEGEEMPVDLDGFSGGDRTRIELPAVQETLLRALQATGKPVIFVLLSGSAVASPWAQTHVAAIVEGWYPGQAGGTALAGVLLGKINPAGRLPVTFYRRTEDLPAFADYRMAGRTYRYFSGPVLYPFGHGLSYTHFSYGRLTVGMASPGSSQRFLASVVVTNDGARDGDEVVQVYAREPDSARPRDRESLCAFQRIHLARGETRSLVLPVTTRALSRWDSSTKTYRVPAGEWKLWVGASSADIRQASSVHL